jgi:hypothetical protein
MPLFVVDTIVTMRMRYVIDAKEASHAEDEVTMIDSGDPDDTFGEFSQKHLGETIVDTRAITKAEYRKMLKDAETTGEGSFWMGDKLIRKIDYVG